MMELECDKSRRDGMLLRMSTRDSVPLNFTAADLPRSGLPN